MASDAQPMLDEEFRSSDNRMDLSVASFPDIEEWEDGKTYTFSEVVVRQQSPGKFMIVSAKPKEGTEGSIDTDKYGEKGRSQDVQGNVGGQEGKTQPVTGNPALDTLLYRRASNQ